MSTLLLSTKTRFPRYQGDVLIRPHLIEQLNQGMLRKLILISAPAGFGKTTLVFDWIQNQNIPAAWINLDERDNDLQQFLAYFLTALRTILPDLAKLLLDEVQSAQFHLSDDFLTDVLNNITLASSQRFVLVLDDFHVLRSQPVLQVIRYLLDYMPQTMHLLISTRADPDLPLARMRGRGELLEIRQRDLRFSMDETAQFLRRIMALEVTDEDLSALTNHTEGWIAGLQMAGISLKNRENTQEFIRSFTGTNRYILDYLIEEVLQSQPEHIQSFLLKTSILERFCEPLSEAVTGEGSTRDVLDHLERNNLFIYPLDDERQWYRYHHLFADLLQKQLQHATEILIPELHMRASRWFEAASFQEEAVEHALLACDFGRAADLVERFIEDVAKRADFSLLKKWSDVLPNAVLLSRPKLGIFHAAAMLRSGASIEAVEGFLGEVEKSLTDSLMEGRATLVHAMIAMFRGNTVECLRLTKRALQEMSDQDTLFHSTAVWLLSVLQFSLGDFGDAAHRLTELIRTSQRTDNLVISVSSLSLLGDVNIRKAKLRAAKKYYEQAIDLAVDERGNRLPIANKALIKLGGIYREWNDFDKAAELLKEGIELAEKFLGMEAVDGYLGWVQLCMARGDLEGARDALLHAHMLAVQSEGIPFDDYIVELMQGRLWVEEGALDTAWRFIQSRGLDGKLDPNELDNEEDYMGYHLRKYEYLLAAQICLAKRQPEKALNYLDPLIPRLERAERYWPLLHVYVYRAMALFELGREEDALTQFDAALKLAEPEGYIRVFLDEAESIKSLLLAAKTQGMHVGYVQVLLEALESVEGKSPALLAARPGQEKISALVEPLSAREMEVLRLLATSMTAAEIGNQLYIAESTVRSHIKNIYEKLNVNKRMMAVERAKQLDLI